MYGVWKYATIKMKFMRTGRPKYQADLKANIEWKHEQRKRKKKQIIKNN